MRVLRRLPLRETTHELLEAVGLLTVGTCAALMLLFFYGGVF
ncbi:hypothetical protein [Natronorubrum sp. DTA7]